MKHVVHSPHLPFPVMGGAATVHQVLSWEDNLIWLLQCNSSGITAAIDGPESQSTEQYCRDQGLDWRIIINTHIHPDHIGINRDLANQGRLGTFQVYGCRHTADKVPGLTDAVDEGDRIRVGTLEGKVMRTEGHIDGHLSYLFGDVLFCGDTLFGAGCGYLFDGPPAKMQKSLERLATLPEHTRVCCAHEYTQDNLRFAWSIEPENRDLRQRIKDTWAIRRKGRSSVPSTIGLEKKTNPFLRWDSPHIKDRLKISSDDPVDIFAATRALKDGKAYRSLSDVDLPLAD